LSWYWENTCYENTVILDIFSSAIEVIISVDITTVPFTEDQLSEYLLQTEVYRFNSTSVSWVSSSLICSSLGFPDTFAKIDLLTYTIYGAFCLPGQYALFVTPVTPPARNTGFVITPNPHADQINAPSGTGKTGWQPPPPPLPIEPKPQYDPSPKLKTVQLHYVYAYDIIVDSGSALTYSLLLISICFLLF